MNKANLLKLAAYLRSLPPDYDRFEMAEFHSEVAVLWSAEERELALDHSCGTSACAVGHGPAAGIELLPNDEDWIGYSERAFGVFGLEWNWCFSGIWGDFDNTPQGAADRIEFLVQTGNIGELPWL